MSHRTGTFGRVYSLTSLYGVLLGQAPVLLVLMIGLILLASPGRRLPPRSVLLARAGLVVMLVETLSSSAWTVLLPQLFARSGSGADFVRSFGLVWGLVNLLMAIVFAAGLALVVAALLGARTPSDPGPPPPFPGPPFSDPPVQ